MTDRSSFESRLEAALGAYADRAPTAVDPHAMTRMAATGSAAMSVVARPRGLLGSRWLIAATIALLVVALVGAALLTGSRPILPNPFAVVPDRSASPVPVRATPAPDASTPEPSFDRLAGDTTIGVGVGPCAPLVQLLSTWVVYDPEPPVTLGPARSAANGDVLAPTSEGITGIRASDGALAAMTEQDITDSERGFIGFPVAIGGRIMPAPDGQAAAIDQGDLGPAGCGEPLVRFAQGGLVRPFGVRAYQSVTNVAWSADGQRLYGILRSTLHASGQPVAFEDLGTGPGHVLEWDVATRQMTDFGAPCDTCGLLQLMPAPAWGGVVVWTLGNAWHGGGLGGWKALGDIPTGIGWTHSAGSEEPDLLVVDGYDHIDTVGIDGNVVTTSGHICCHGNGYGGLLSPDHVHVVGSTLANDFNARDILVVDVQDGSQRIVAKMPQTTCSPSATGHVGQMSCYAEPSGSPAAVPFLDPGRIVSWSPDGTSILLEAPAVQTGDTTSKLWTFSLVTGVQSAALEYPGTEGQSGVVWLPRLP